MFKIFLVGVFLLSAAVSCRTAIFDNEAQSSILSGDSSRENQTNWKVFTANTGRIFEGKSQWFSDKEVRNSEKNPRCFVSVTSKSQNSPSEKFHIYAGSSLETTVFSKTGSGHVGGMAWYELSRPPFPKFGKIGRIRTNEWNFAVSFTEIISS